MLFAFLIQTETPAQVIKFQSVGGAGGFAAQANNGTLKHSGVLGTVVSQGTGVSNQAGFFWGNPDFRPAQQTSAVLLSGLAPTQLTLNWSNGNGTRRIVVGRAGSAVTATIASGNYYTANAAFGSGTEVGTGNFVVYEGMGSTVTVTTLSPSVVYYFKAFEYNGKYGSSNVNIEYQAGDAAGNPVSQTTLATAPTSAPSALAFSLVTKNQSTLSWTNGDGANRLVIVKQGNAVNAQPANGMVYIANAAFGLGVDLGASNFVSFNAATNQVTLTGLLPNTLYYYQIVEYKGSGADNNYLTATTTSASQLTLTVEPLAKTESSITQTSFAANWDAVTGAVNYYVDVSDNANFTTFVASNQNRKITGLLTASVTGLAGGTNYYYRVRAENAAGQSANSNTIKILTVPATPVQAVSTAITTTSFMANWSASSSATDYFIDVATDANFTQLVSGYDNLQIAGTTSLAVSALKAGTNYYMRVRAKNTSGISTNSTAYNQITIPVAPVLLDTDTQLTDPTSFVAQWNAVTGASGYDVAILKVLNDNTTQFVSMVSSQNISAKISGLPSSQLYQYSVQAKNAGGSSASSNSKYARTKDSNGQSSVPKITVDATQSAISSIQAAVAGGIGTVLPIQLFFKHRSIVKAGKFVSEAPVSLASINTSNKQTIDASWADELGIEYYFVARDAANQVDSTASTLLYKSFTSEVVPTIKSISGGSQVTYGMFSIPAELTSNRIDDVFQPVIAQYGGYTKTKWRMFHYQGGKYVEYKAGLETIDKGLGYWLTSVEVPADVKITGSVIKASQTSPFKITLEQGWNQIGNPFPFNIDWTAMQTANAAAGLNSLWLFEGGNYVKKTVLATWKGAFVYSDKGGEISFPVSTKTTASGRVEEKIELTLTPDSDSWQLPLQLELNDQATATSVGMHPQANRSKDKYDEITIPRFISYLEMDTDHKEFFASHFATDVVPTEKTKEWIFDMASSLKEGTAKLTWPQAELAKSQANFLLIDLLNQQWLDMKTTPTYSFEWKEGRQLKLVYSKEGELNPGITLLGQAYPNPFASEVTIPLLLEKENMDIQIQVYDLLGKHLKTVAKQFAQAGAQSFVWDGKDEQGNDVSAGLLLYRLSDGKNNSYQVKKMIKK